MYCLKNAHVRRFENDKLYYNGLLFYYQRLLLNLCQHLNHLQFLLSYFMQSHFHLIRKALFIIMRTEEAWLAVI